MLQLILSIIVDMATLNCFGDFQRIGNFTPLPFVNYLEEKIIQATIIPLFRHHYIIVVAICCDLSRWVSHGTVLLPVANLQIPEQL